jgi:hypothetical protein
MIKRACLLILCSLSLAAQSYASTKAQLPGLAIKLLTDKTAYSTGEPVKITFMVINKSLSDANLLFGSGQSYDIMITDRNDRDIWHWSYDKVFTMAVRHVKVSPRQNLKYALTWQQVDNKGRPVPQGKYFIRGRLTSALQLDSPIRTVIIK